MEVHFKEIWLDLLFFMTFVGLSRPDYQPQDFNRPWQPNMRQNQSRQDKNLIYGHGIKTVELSYTCLYCYNQKWIFPQTFCLIFGLLFFLSPILISDIKEENLEASSMDIWKC